MWLVPEAVCPTARNCSIHVNMTTVHQLQEELGGSEGRDLAFCFVDAEFEAEANEILAKLNYPVITLLSAWDIFIAITNAFSADYM
jgi:hypothetical protein